MMGVVLYYLEILLIGVNIFNLERNLNSIHQKYIFIWNNRGLIFIIIIMIVTFIIMVVMLLNVVILDLKILVH